MAIFVFQHGPHSGADRLAAVLRDHGHPLRFFALHDDEPLPPDLDDCHGIISCGGDASANDDALPWLMGEIELLREAHEVQMPIVGLCLGSQIIGRALGGTIDLVQSGMRVGWLPVKLTEFGREDPLHAGMPWTSTMFHWNREEVREFPPGARLLTAADGCKHQAWAVGLRTYAFQYHPEITPNRVMQWCDDHPADLATTGFDRAQLTQQTDAHYAVFHRVTERLFENIALMLMPIDRRYAGIAKDLHH